MKFKSLLFGSAAVLAAGTGAQAADLPTAEPVEYVRICDAFGTGFYYIPGTDTCLRVSGRVRIEAHYVDTDFEGLLEGRFGSAQDNWTTRARGNVRLDARTQTDWGMVRAFINLQGTIGPGDGFSDLAFPIDSGPNYNGSGFDLDQAFIQIARDIGTFTAGHVDSFFDAPFSSNTFGTRIGIDDPTGSQTLFGYTFAGGNGFSASISLEDPATKPGRFNGDDDYEGQEMPDLVANVRLDQGWGSAFLAGAARHIHDINDDGFGWAVNASVVATFGMFGFGVTGGYADGALNYITNDPGGVGDFSQTDGDNTNSAWAIRGGVAANFSPTLVAQVDASYTSVNDDNAAPGDYNFWAIVADLVWKPVDGLIMGPEVAYSNFDWDTAPLTAHPDSAWGVMWRIQRDF
jgi:opacity protein-like surface antigen